MFFRIRGKKQRGVCKDSVLDFFKFVPLFYFRLLQLSCQNTAPQNFGGSLLNGLLQPLNFSIDPVPCIVRTF